MPRNLGGLSMYRTDRHLNKKKNGQHNFFGEEENIEILNGNIVVDLMDDDSPPENHNDPSEEQSG